MAQESTGVEMREVIRKQLAGKGITGPTSASVLAKALDISSRTVKNAEHKGQLAAIDKSTYDLEAVISWLEQCPRYISKREPNWNVYEGTAPLIESIVMKSWRVLLNSWQMEDLVAEVQFRMLRMRRSTCSESTVIIRILASIWKKQNRIRTVPFHDNDK